MTLRDAPESSWDQFTSVEKVVLTRRSTRRYKKMQVPVHLVRRVLEAARFAPSAGNCQPWRFIVIQNKNMLEEMTRLLLAKMKPLEKVVAAQGWKRDVTVAAVGLLKSQNQGDLRPFGAVREVLSGRLKIFHNAPTLILVLKDTRGIDSPEFDTGICCQNLVLTAHSLGLGTCYIGFAHFLEGNREWMSEMGIEKPWKIATAITLGYPFHRSDGLCQRDQPQIDFYDETGPKKTLY